MKVQNSCKGSRQKAGEKMGEVIVSMKDIVKTFPGVKALDHVNFELRSGEVMALLGENGAGKSTLMKILSGVYTKDSGTMTIFGTEYENLTPKQAQAVGVAIIHQELNMCRHLSVAENMFLGREKVNGIVLNDREMEAEAEKILGDLKIDIDPRQTVGDLPVSKSTFDPRKDPHHGRTDLIPDSEGDRRAVPDHPSVKGGRMRNRLYFPSSGGTQGHR